jgi:anti-sigma factor RsiW
MASQVETANMAELNDDDRAELVAYLDGELGEDASQAFEARLSRDKRLRAEADALKKTWEMLDFLPRAEPSASFTHRTLERLAVPNTGRQAAARARLWKWAAIGGWAAGLLIAVGAGLIAAHLFWPAPHPDSSQLQTIQQADVEALIVRDLDLIRNKRLYDNADNLDFVRSLPEAFGDDDEEGAQ